MRLAWVEQQDPVKRKNGREGDGEGHIMGRNTEESKEGLRWICIVDREKRQNE